MVHGEPGIGKTALLECALETGREFRVAGICGVESEMELAFAALQQLCCPYLVPVDLYVARDPGGLRPLSS